MSSNPVLRNFLITVGALILVGIAAYAYFYPRGSGSSQIASTTTQTLSDGTVIQVPAGATVTETTEPEVKAPDFAKPITITTDLNADARAALQGQFEETKRRLTANPQDFDSWIRLGTLRKIAGDYAGAAEVWEYTTKIYPSSSVAFSNLGDLYMYFIKNYAKAEVNFKQTIALAPHIIDSYRSLFYLYRDIYKDSAKAEAIRAEGLKNNPGNADLQKI